MGRGRRRPEGPHAEVGTHVSWPQRVMFGRRDRQSPPWKQWKPGWPKPTLSQERRPWTLKRPGFIRRMPNDR